MISGNFNALRVAKSLITIFLFKFRKALLFLESIAQGICKPAKRKKKSTSGSVHLTKELFQFKKDLQGIVRLFIGNKKFPIGELKISKMTKKAKPKQEANGKWMKNQAAQKSGLNRSILRVGWHKLETLTRYKAYRRGSLLVKISPQFSSQECADCSHIHPANRKNQAEFVCLSCGHRDNADSNAALVLKKRAIKLLKHSGTELSDRGVLHLVDIGRGVHRKISKQTARKQGLRSVKKDGEGRELNPEATPL